MDNKFYVIWDAIVVKLTYGSKCYSHNLCYTPEQRWCSQQPTVVCFVDLVQSTPLNSWGSLRRVSCPLRPGSEPVEVTQYPLRFTLTFDMNMHSHPPSFTVLTTGFLMKLRKIPYGFRLESVFMHLKPRVLVISWSTRPTWYQLSFPLINTKLLYLVVLPWRNLTTSSTSTRYSLWTARVSRSSKLRLISRLISWLWSWREIALSTKARATRAEVCSALLYGFEA